MLINGYFRFVGLILDFQLPVRLLSISSSPIGLLYPKNIGICVRLSLLSCLQVEIDLFPDWIADFRFRRTVFQIVPLNSLLLKTWA